MQGIGRHWPVNGESPRSDLGMASSGSVCLPAHRGVEHRSTSPWSTSPPASAPPSRRQLEVMEERVAGAITNLHRQLLADRQEADMLVQQSLNRLEARLGTCEQAQ
ncbi:unnamed protein product, partial [Polarella glacialis]